MSAWNMDFIRKLAGLPAQESKQLNEGWDDGDDYGDDEDPDVRIAGEDKSQKKFEKKNKKELKSADTESKELAAKKKPAAEPKKEAPKKAVAEKPAEKKEAPKAEPKKAAAEKPAEKKETPKKEPVIKADDGKEKSDAELEKEHEESSKKAGAMWDALAKGQKHKPEKKAEKPAEKAEGDAEAKKRGRAHNPDSKQGKAREWLASNANHTRGAFIKHMVDNHQMSKHHANTMYYAEKKRSGTKTDVKEVFFLQHPHMTSFLLGENREMNKFDWVDHDSKIEPLVFETAAEAEKMVKYMSEWKGQPVKVVTYTFEDDQLNEGESYETLDGAADCHMDAHVNGDTSTRARAEREITHRFGDEALVHVKKRSASFAARAAKNDVGPESKAEAADHLARARLAVKK